MLLGHKITVLTCSYGHSATPPYPTKDTTAAYVHLTTDKTKQVEGWKTTVAKVSPDANMRRASRIPKMQPWRIAPESTWLIWIDARVELKMPARDVIDIALHSCPWASIWAHPHRCRHGIYAEAAAIIRRGDACSEPDWAERLIEQVRCYAIQRWPKEHGLWEMGVMVWNMQHHEQCRKLGNEWRRQYTAGCERDQISFPIAAYNAGVEIGNLPGHLANSQLCEVHPPTLGS